jgi:mRNA interferase MazF
MSKDSYPKRGEVYWVKLDPVIGSEINKTRPAVIVSNDAGNAKSKRVIVAPITSTVTHVYPFETKITLDGRDGKIMLDQIRSIDKQRLLDRIYILDLGLMHQVDKALKIALALT